jgi:hypothetical protein
MGVGVLCVKPLPRVRRTFAVFLLLVMPLAGLGACDMCISVVTLYTESGCASRRNKFLCDKNFFSMPLCKLRASYCSDLYLDT